MNRQILTIGIGVAAVAVVAWLFLRPAPVETPADSAPVVPATTPEQRAEDARSVIASLQAADPIDYDLAFERARGFQAQGQLADAQLLYFFAARAEHAPSAFELASMYDPNHHDPATSLFPDPDPFQAYRWYSVARDRNLDAAAERLDALHGWAETAAAGGDAEAERLLLQWE